ncbi:hypothetical protein EMGBS15_16720 [Filimonas sp.]|nr:hypothetical protein EMGBS15_16720 [Filimonas sp.]
MRRISCIVLLLIANLSAFSQGAPRQVPGTEGQKSHDEAKVNSSIPVFQFVTAQGKFISEADLPKNKPVIMALFSPTCDHCQRAVAAIKERMNDFNEATIIFVTSITNFSELDNFEKITELGNYPNLYVCAAQDAFITKFFMPNWILPQVMVFNKQQKLKKIYYETINTDSVLNYMKK